MKYTFKNELSKEERKQGLFGYMMKRFNFLRSAVLLTIIFALLLIWNILDGTLFTQSTLILICIYAVFFVMMLGLSAFSYQTIAKQYDAHKQEKFTITDEKIIISNAKNEKQEYSFLQVQKCLAYKDVYILFLTRQEFALISKKAIGDHITSLQKKIKEVQNG